MASRLRLLASATGALGALGLAGPAVATVSTPAASASMSIKAEAWYRSLPPCTTAFACVTAPSPYSPKTLHVGTAAGHEESRTYLTLALPPGIDATHVASAVLHLPLATGPDDGTLQPASADLAACRVAGRIEDGVDGATSEAPAADCASAAALASFDPSAYSGNGEFEVDLGVFLPYLESGTLGLALLPSGTGGAGATWHAAFSRTDRDVPGSPPITATLTLESAIGTSTRPTPTTTPVPASHPPSTVTAPLPSAPATVSSPAPAPRPVVASPVTEPPPARTAASEGLSPFEYPEIWLVPFLLAGFGVWAARAMTENLHSGAASST